MTKILQFICRIPNRIYSVLAVIFLATGINLVTSELSDDVLSVHKLIVGLVASGIGISCFIFEATSEKCQRNAKAYQNAEKKGELRDIICLLYTSPSPRD